MDLSKLLYVYLLLHGFVKIDTWISLSWYMDFKVAAWICQSCFMYFLLLVNWNQTQVWPIYQSLLKLLLWTKGVEWVKVLIALGLLCLWQCLPNHKWTDNPFYLRSITGGGSHVDVSDYLRKHDYAYYLNGCRLRSDEEEKDKILMFWRSMGPRRPAHLAPPPWDNNTSLRQLLVMSW